MYVVGNKSLALQLRSISQFYSQEVRARHLSLFKLCRFEWDVVNSVTVGYLMVSHVTALWNAINCNVNGST